MGNYGAEEQEALGNNEIYWEASLLFVNIMVQGIMTNPIELCDKFSQDMRSFGGSETGNSCLTKRMWRRGSSCMRRQVTGPRQVNL